MCFGRAAQTFPARIAAIWGGDATNGQPLTIDYPNGLSPDEREIVRRSDEAFIRVRQTWARWKTVRAGLVILETPAIRAQDGSTEGAGPRLGGRAIHRVPGTVPRT